MEKITVRIIETRTVITELDPKDYPEGQKDQKGMFEIERNNASENVEYMDWLDADSVLTIERIEGK